MNIKNTKGLYRVCELILNEIISQKNLWDIVWDSKIDSKILTQNNGRCYFIVVNDIIYKIGYSDSNGGIKNTIMSYKGSGNSGRPSDRTHGIHVLITHELLNNNKVEIYLSYNKNISYDTIDMFGETKNEIIRVSGKNLESINKKIFFDINESYPKWNFQENFEKWPSYILQSNSDLNMKNIHLTLDKVKENLIFLNTTNLNKL